MLGPMVFRLGIAAVFHSPAGFAFTPPPGFEPMPDLPARSSRALAPAPPGAHTELIAAFAEKGEAPASMAVSVVEAPLVLDRGSPERTAELAIDYLHELLNVDLHIEWIERLPEASANVASGAGGLEAIELAGRVRLPAGEGDETLEERVAQFAFVPFGKRQLVITASIPSGRFAALGPEIESAISSLTFDAGQKPQETSFSEIGALVGGGVGLVIALTRLLWRRREASLTAPKQHG